MAKFTFFFGALLTFAACLPYPGLQSVFAMGPGNVPDRIQEEGNHKEQAGQSPEKDAGTEKGMKKDSHGGKEEISPPEKKPRLKYRDLYECGC